MHFLLLKKRTLFFLRELVGIVKKFLKSTTYTILAVLNPAMISSFFAHQNANCLCK